VPRDFQKNGNVRPRRRDTAALEEEVSEEEWKSIAGIVKLGPTFDVVELSDTAERSKTVELMTIS
jgi:hypothetical protein